MQHLEEGTIHAWLDGALSTTDAREVEQHAAGCAECSAMVAEARGLIAGASRIVSSLDVVRGNVIPKTPASKGGGSLWRSLHLTPARAALAATLLIAVSSLLTVRHNTNDKMVMPTPAAPAPAVAAPSAETKAPAATPPLRQESPASAPRVAARKSEPSALASNPVKDQPSKPSEEPAARDAKAKADVVERRDSIAASRVVASADSVRTATDSVASAAARSVAAGAAPANAPRLEKQDQQRENAIREAARRVHLNEVGTTGVVAQFGPNGAPACYQFVPPVASPKLPQRFALQNLPSDTTRHVVRAVSEAGRLDSVLTGSEWTRTNQTELTVRFAANERPVTLQVRDASLGVATVGDSRFAAPTSLNVSRLACRP